MPTCPGPNVYFPFEFYRQGGLSPWASDHLDDSEDTIGGSGCLLTCLAMIAPGGGVTPGQLNSILSSPAYNLIDDTGSLVNVASVVKDYFGYEAYAVINEDALSKVDINAEIVSLMNNGNIMIAHVESRHHTPAGHFVLITGQVTDELGRCHVEVADPSGNSNPFLDQYVLNELRVIYPGVAITTPTVTPSPFPTDVNI